MPPPSIVPYLTYRDPAAALRFLEEGLGLRVVVRWDGEDGSVQHAEVAVGDGVVMLATAEHHEAPLEGFSVGQGVYVAVEDDELDARFARARAAGARVVFSPEATDWGTRRFRVLDPEGYEWSVGTYRPGER
jgi:uncharacterized glyoxalase superfamily protein PhnB